MTPVLLRNSNSPSVSGALALGPRVAVTLALVLSVAACSSGTSKAKSETTTTKPKVLTVRTSALKIGSVDIENAGPQSVQIDPATGAKVLGAAQAYVDAAYFAPLKTGLVGAGYAALFDAGVRSAATGVDEPALTDLDVGKATSLSTRATPVTLSALAGPPGRLLYIATDFGFTLYATAANGPVMITHSVELTFAPTGKTWTVTAYRVGTISKSKTATTTTTASGGTAP
jgi:hypothetical protein